MLDPMEFQDVVNRRRMIREYAQTPVDPAILDRALTNATHAPSAGFSQGWGFLVLDQPGDVRRWWRATSESTDTPDAWLTGMMQAPVVIVPCANKSAYVQRYAEPDKGWIDQAEERWPVPYWQLDTAMASLLILQTAVDEGLGGCFFGIPPDKVASVREEFRIEPAFEPIGAITLGHPALGDPKAGARKSGSATTRPRKPITEVVHRGNWV